MTAACDERRRLAADRGTRKKIQVIPYSLGLRILWGARRRRLASTVLTYPVDMLVRRESVSRRNFSLERPGGSHQQSNTHRGGLVAKGPHQGNPIVARLPSVAHILKKSPVFFALKADGCEDSTTWHKNGDPAKDCAWVSEWAPRCQVKGADKSLASEHCTCACPK